MVSDNIMVDFGWDPEEKPWAEQEPISAYDDVPPQAVSRTTPCTTSRSAERGGNDGPQHRL